MVTIHIRGIAPGLAIATAIGNTPQERKLVRLYLHKGTSVIAQQDDADKVIERAESVAGNLRAKGLTVKGISSGFCTWRSE